MAELPSIVEPPSNLEPTAHTHRIPTNEDNIMEVGVSLGWTAEGSGGELVGQPAARPCTPEVIAEPVGLTPGVADLGDLEDDPYASDYDGPVGPWSRKSRFVNIEPEIDTDDAVDAPEADDVLPPQTTTQLILNQMEDMVALQTVTNDYLGQILAETRRTRQLFERLSQHLGNPPKPPPVAPKPGAVRPGG